MFFWGDPRISPAPLSPHFPHTGSAMEAGPADAPASVEHSRPMYVEALTIVGVSVASALFCELVNYLLLYRTSSYQTLQETLKRTSKRLESAKAAAAAASPIAGSKGNKPSSSKTKKADRFEKTMQETSRDLSFVKLKSTVVMTVTLSLMYGVLSASYEGIPVARLPFDPPGFVQGISHRGLVGEDMRDCSMAFLYMLCSMSIKQNISKALGFAPPRAATAAMGESLLQAAEKAKTR